MDFLVDLPTSTQRLNAFRFTEDTKMTTPKLTSQDRKDLDKFTKYFVYKCIQIIVQSRLGTKMKTKSKAFSTGSDWVISY